MVSIADICVVGLAVAVAVIVTVPPVGTVEGAMKDVVTCWIEFGLSLAVCCGMNEPQALPPHVTLQSIPICPAAFGMVPSVTKAARFVALPAGIEAGGVTAIVIVTTGGRMVTVALALAEGSATDVAVIVTVFPAGTADGAM
jgi:hypothetical protein